MHQTDELYSIGAVITDLEMPVTSGFEVLKQIKNSKEFQHIPVIINTSMSSESNIQMAKSLRADAFITKLKATEIEFELRKILEHTSL